MYYFAKTLNKNHELSIIMFDACKEHNAFKTTIAAFSDTIVFIEDKPRNALYKRLVFPWDMSFYIKKNTAVLAGFIAKKSYDAVFIAFPLALSMVHTLPKLLLSRTIYIEDDLLVPKFLSEGKKIKNPIRKMIHLVRILQLNHLFSKNMKHINDFVFISEQEKEIGRKYFPHPKAHIVGYGIDITEFTFHATKKLTPIIGFIGNYLHVPNSDAVEHFLTDLFPVIIREIPQISVVIAGKNMPDSWLGSKSPSNSIHYEKEVNNLNVFYRNIDIFINPIISGRGLRTKLIESAACGVPIVSTKLGAEGLEDLKIEIAENGKEFSEKIQMLYLNKKLFSEIALSNRSCVENNYTIDAVGKKLELILQ